MFLFERGHKKQWPDNSVLNCQIFSHHAVTLRQKYSVFAAIIISTFLQTRLFTDCSNHFSHHILMPPIDRTSKAKHDTAHSSCALFTHIIHMPQSFQWDNLAVCIQFVEASFHHSEIYRHLILQLCFLQLLHI